MIKRKGVQMAAKCPNCGKEIKWYNLKADCSACGVSIPNFNWEARLEEDNKKAEEKFGAFYRTLNLFKYSVVGTKLRVARIIMSFIPIIGVIVPWLSIKGDSAALNFDLLGLFTDGTSTIDFFGILFKDLGGIISSISAEGFSGPISFAIFGLISVLLSIVILVIAFFLIFITFKNPKTKAMCVFDILGLVFMGVGIFFFTPLNGKIGAEPFSIAELTFENAVASVQWGIFVFLALGLVALLGNCLVAKADIKSEETLEEERLEKVRIKEEKEEQARIRKEQQRLEAEMQAEIEKEEKIRKAKEALAKKNKK